MPSSSLLIAAARTYIGIPWLHQGRNRQGVDCVGLLICAMADIGIEIPDMQGYRRAPDPEVFVGHIHANSLPEKFPFPGTLGVFRDGSQPCHVGIFATMYDQMSLIHAAAGPERVKEELFIHDLPGNLISIRRFKGLIY
jgi:cell wall-associated NlpC family hydrolase